MLRALFAFVLAAVVATPAFAQGPPDAQTLLQRAGAAYRGLAGYHIESVLDVRQVTGAGTEQSLQVPLVMAGDRSGRMRMEIRQPEMGALVVSDGRQLSTFMAQLQQYTSKPAPALPDSATMPLPPQGSPLVRYFGLPEGVRSATVMGEQPVEIGGRGYPCWVVRCDVTPPQILAADSAAQAISTFWLDKSRALVLRDSTVMVVHDPASGIAQTTTRVLRMTHVSDSAAPPDSLFRFVPPVGARLVDAFGSPQQLALADEFVGKPAPGFTLTGIKGSTISLARYKGKVVLLDFWATWCRPCRIEMPLVQKLHDEFKTKGLAVFGVNFNEDAAKVKSFLAENSITFPILLDPEAKVAARYKADSIPTLVIIDKEGRVSSYFTGLREESTLREALAKAGIQ